MLWGLPNLQVVAEEFDAAVVPAEYTQPEIALTDFLQEKAPEINTALFDAEPLESTDELVLLPEMEELEQSAADQSVHIDPAVEPVVCYDCPDCVHYIPSPSYPCDPCGCRTMSCLAGPYFKTGWNGVIADGIFDTFDQLGYNFSLGYRQPLGMGFGGRRLFFDTGASYMSAFGTTTRSVRGKEVDGITNVSTPKDDAYSVTLTEIRRTGIHGGVGWYFGSLFDTPSEDPQARLGLIVGGRFADMHGVDTVEELDGPATGNTQTSLAKTTDMSGGIYVELEWLLLRRNSPIGDCQWTLDGEFAHDWVDFEGFEQRGLATASLLFGFMVAR